MGWVCICRRRSWRVSPFPGNSSQPGSSAAPARASPDFARRFYPATAAPLPSPLPVRRPGPPSRNPPAGARGDGAAPPWHETPSLGRAGSRCQPRPEPPAPPLSASALRPGPVSPGGRGRPTAPSRPSPAHGGQCRPPGRRRAGAEWKLTWG